MYIKVYKPNVGIKFRKPVLTCCFDPEYNTQRKTLRKSKTRVFHSERAVYMVEAGNAQGGVGYRI